MKCQSPFSRLLGEGALSARVIIILCLRVVCQCIHAQRLGLQKIKSFFFLLLNKYMSGALSRRIYANRDALACSMRVHIANILTHNAALCKFMRATLLNMQIDVVLLYEKWLIFRRACKLITAILASGISWMFVVCLTRQSCMMIFVRHNIDWN